MQLNETLFAGLVGSTPTNIRQFQATMDLTDNSTDDMDKKLLLSIQSECNAQGINIPWNNIAAIVGPTITGSAVIQHLAKLRIRMFPNTLHYVHLRRNDLVTGC